VSARPEASDAIEASPARAGAQPMARGARWSRRGLALAAGATAVAGFAPAAIAPLVLLALALLFFLAVRVAPREAFALGYAWGVGFFGAGVSWVYVSLHDFGMIPAPLAATGTALFCLYLALYPALACGAV